jgi:DNA polymerase (family 10)
MLITDARAHFKRIEAELEGKAHVYLAGSARRGKRLCGDVDLVVQPIAGHRQLLEDFVLEKIGKPLGDKVHVAWLEEPSHQIEFYIAKEDGSDLGAQLFTWTGSKDHNMKMRSFAKRNGWKLNQYGVFDGDRCLTSGFSEEEIMKLLGVKFVEPKYR